MKGELTQYGNERELAKRRRRPFLYIPMGGCILHTSHHISVHWLLYRQLSRWQRTHGKLPQERLNCWRLLLAVETVEPGKCIAEASFTPCCETINSANSGLVIAPLQCPVDITFALSCSYFIRSHKHLSLGLHFHRFLIIGVTGISSTSISFNRGARPVYSSVWHDHGRMTFFGVPLYEYDFGKTLTWLISGLIDAQRADTETPLSAYGCTLAVCCVTLLPDIFLAPQVPVVTRSSISIKIHLSFQQIIQATIHKNYGFPYQSSRPGAGGHSTNIMTSGLHPQASLHPSRPLSSHCGGV